eukprot:gb/GECG01014773.1/.p1 GENE.gb/GECG01014773.1/~~gb/GECG01014773.1/.p1  ORF type:complete len:205 (+),score=7.68 gb/GECG01014773.1/:1-615(+)
MVFSFSSSWLWTFFEYASVAYVIFGLIFGLVVSFWILAGHWSNSLQAFMTDTAPKVRKSASKYKDRQDLRQAIKSLAYRLKDTARGSGATSVQDKDRGLLTSLVFPEELPEHLYFPEEFTVPRPLPRKVRAFLDVDPEGKRQSGFLKPRTPVSPHVNSNYPMTRLEALRLVFFAIIIGPARLLLAIHGCFFCLGVHANSHFGYG